MPCPRFFQDDGRTLRLDVHGCTIREAITLVTRCLQEGRRRGRGQLEVVTGYSTTTAHDAATIKNVLARGLENGDFGAWATGWVWSSDGGRCVIALPLGERARPERILLRDVLPR